MVFWSIAAGRGNEPKATQCWLGDTVGAGTTDLSDLIRKRIETLRPKLLDLGRRNPLISTKLTPRTASVVRMIDELPEVIRFNLVNQVPLRFIPLPPLDDDPRDEQTSRFEDALSAARLSDDTYLAALEATDLIQENGADGIRKVERELKDRVRAALGMPPRQMKAELSLQQHALNNGISPQWELPEPQNENEDGRHSDTDIQTLLLPDDLVRRLNGLSEKCRSWEQETGINVLHIAFGFLEWKDSASSDSSFAPLALLPVMIEKRKTRDGAEFWIKADGDETETNFVLAEKLRLEFGVDLPKYAGGSIEEYLKEVAEAAPSTMTWTVRRQMVLGIFPSARMALYLDLDTRERQFETNEVISSLFGGNSAFGATPFADEYDTDEPTIEAKVPYLVLDADSSQFSAIVDVADGKNLAVEGPPGTGKSQTIVNVIANALAQGKKVLFVAEKMAALEVVKARLEAVGLGEFLLPLQAERSTREQVIQSVRARTEIATSGHPRDYDNRIEKFRQTRAELARYIDAISSRFGKTGLSVHDVLGKSIATNDALSVAPRRLQTPTIRNVETLTQVQIETARERSMALAKAWDTAREAGPYWAGIECTEVSRFIAMELAGLAKDASVAHANADDARQMLSEYGFHSDISADELAQLSEAVGALVALSGKVDLPFVKLVHETGAAKLVGAFLLACEEAKESRRALAMVLKNLDEPAVAVSLREAAALCTQHGLRSLAPSILEAELEVDKHQLRALEKAFLDMKPFVDHLPAAVTIPFSVLTKAAEMVRSTDSAALMVRCELIARPGGSGLLAQLCQTGRELKASREELSASISTSTTLTVGELRSHAQALRSAGAFGWMSSTVRAAKKAYVAHANGAAFERYAAIQALDALAKWKDAAQRYDEDIQARAVFGLYFKGIDTNFSPFEMLSVFFDRIDEVFAGPAYRDLRALLKTGDYDLVTSIPEIAVGGGALTFEELGASISQRRNWLDAKAAAVEQIARLTAAVRSPEETGPEELEDLAERLDAVLTATARLDSDRAIADILGARFDGSSTRLDGLASDLKALAIIASAPQAAPTIISLIERDQLRLALDCVTGVMRADDDASHALLALRSKTGPAIVEAVKGLTYREIANYLAEASMDGEGIYVHSRLQFAYKDVDELGYGWVVEELDHNQIRLTDLPRILEAVIARAMAVRVYELYGSTLAKYPGVKLDDLRANVARLDREIIRLSRVKLRDTLARSASPPSGNSVGRKSDLTEMALLSHELSKKTRFAPVRDLTRRAGRALLELKPCWMMSPLAVAQYLPTSAMFDLCIIDEASQMPPEDAVGALSRCHQAVIVGDTNQLPPTSFFRTMIEDDDVDEDDAVLDESILEMANGVFRPARRLRWHYRSKHSGLIAFSNRHIYSSDLIVFPSPSETRSDMGVSLVEVAGCYKSGVNADEASAMIQATLLFMRTYPDRSLGLVTLNQKQRDLLLEEWDRALARDPNATAYVEEWAERNDGLERFFIKNLENVQGDERDVIFIGTVYGPEKVDGPVMQRFGPISGLAGKRRLNVLFSRAKKQIVTFSSMRAIDIRAEEHTNPGAYMLRRWLEYSATGMLHSGDTRDVEPESEFEVYVINQLRAMGFDPVPQVGVSGFRIDIGVRHPSWPHGFIMGVECDGATYHSSRSARDRDRLREQVLRDLGWELHRIWSTDWFTDPGKEAARLRKAIELRLEALQRDRVFVAPAASSDPTTEAVCEPQGSEEFVHSEVRPLDGEMGTSPLISAVNGTQSDAHSIETGDTVRVFYLDGDLSAREVTLSDTRNAPDQGVVHKDAPLGVALIGAEEGDEVEILVGNSVRVARVDKVIKGKAEVASEEPSPSRPVSVSAPQTDLFGVQRAAPVADVTLDAERFYDAAYLPILTTLTCSLVDRLAPITFRHLSELVARAHGFQRTGSQIKSRVWGATSKYRRHSRDGNGESTFWPTGMEPVQVITFRGMVVASEQREWSFIPYAEKLGLAVEVRRKACGDYAAAMADRIGLARLQQSTRAELEALLEQASRIDQDA